MNLFSSLSGTVRVELASADPTGVLTAANGKGIELFDVEMRDDVTVHFTIFRRDHRKLRAIAGKRGEDLRVKERRGIYWALKRMLKRPIFVLGLAMLFLMAMYVPSRVFIIEVQGNGTVPSNRIVEAAENCGIRFGASRRQVRSEQVKNALLEAMPELGWAGVNTYGCRAVISVREREPEPVDGEKPPVSSIVAVRDGYILSCDVFSGNGLCTPGQAVKAGEVLISGYTDCGIRITATRASGEVVAATSRSVRVVTPSECIKKTGNPSLRVEYSLIVGKNRINFNKNSGILDALCGRMVTNYHLTLPGGYRLPVTLVKETVTDADLTAAGVNGEALLRTFAARYLGAQMIAGTVTEAMETVTEEDGVWVLTGEYACTEMIGRERAEQNGELHETN